MKEDNISQLGDYDAPFCEQQYRHGSCYISLFKFKSVNTPQTASYFRHLLSCGTIELHIAICLTAWVLLILFIHAMPSVNFIAMTCESTSLNGIAADKSHCVTLALDI